MKFSILVPLHDKDKKLWPMTRSCLDSIVRNSYGQDYELLIEDGQEHRKVSYTNTLWQRAKGDYLILVGNDVIIDDQDWLQKLAVPGTITSFLSHPSPFNSDRYLDFAVLCVPRDVLDRVGLLDEQFADGYGYDDNDWFMRATKLDIPLHVVPVRAMHAENQTYSAYFTLQEKKVLQDRNWELFKRKWNI